MARILCVGNVSADLIVVPKHNSIKVLGQNFLIAKGTKIDVESIKLSVGGSASNIARSLQSSGHEVTVLSQIGDDYYGQHIHKFLTKSKIKSKLIKHTSIPTVVSSILLYASDRTIFTANFDLDYSCWHEYLDQDYDWIVLGPIHGLAPKLYKSIIQAIINTKARLAIIPSLFQIKNDSLSLKQILKVTDVYISNLDEASQLVHNVTQSDQKRLGATISQYGPQIVAVTKGKFGAFIYSNDMFFERPSVENKNILDTTGAGDAFAGGLVATLATSEIFNENAILSGIEAGLINSSNKLSSYGASEGILNKKQFSEIWNRFGL